MGSSSTSTQKSEPSDFIKPYLSEAMGGAQEQYKAGMPKYYENSTVAGFSPETQAALSAMSRQGMSGIDQRAQSMAGSNYAMNQFAGGGLGDWGTVDQMRNLGLTNNYGQDRGVANIMSRMGQGTDLALNLQNRTGDVVANGGGVGSFSDSRVGDLSKAGPNTLAQFRGDVGDIISGQAQALNPAMIPLMDTAGGGYLNANPYLNQAFSKAADNVTRAYQTSTAPAIDSAFSRSSGALRSGAAMNARDQAQENLGKTLSGLATDIYGGNYANERQNQLSAANSLGNLYQSGLGLRTSAAGTSAGQGTADASTRLAATGQIANDMSGDAARRLQASNAMTQAEQGDLNNFMAANDRLSQAFNTGADRQMSALNSANNMYNASRAQQLQALGMQPGFLQQQQEMNYTDLNNALGAGQMRDQKAQDVLNADIARWDYNQNAPRNNVNWYLNSINGIPGQTNSSITQQGGNPLGMLFSGMGGLGSLALGLGRMGLKF